MHNRHLITEGDNRDLAIFAGNGLRNQCTNLADLAQRRKRNVASLNQDDEGDGSKAGIDDIDVDVLRFPLSSRMKSEAVNPSTTFPPFSVTLVGMATRGTVVRMVES